MAKKNVVMTPEQEKELKRQKREDARVAEENRQKEAEALRAKEAEELVALVEKRLGKKAEEVVVPEKPALPLDRFCYFDDGLSLKMVDAEYKGAAGEQVFKSEQSVDALRGLFKGYPKPDVYCYSNEGHSMRVVPAGHKAQKGEIVLEHEASEEELAELFSGYDGIAQKYAIREEIESLEGEITDRRRDEFILGTDTEWLPAQRAKIDALREQLK